MSDLSKSLTIGIEDSLHLFIGWSLFEYNLKIFEG